MLSLCQKSGSIITGEEGLLAIRRGKAHLTIIAKDASDNTQKKYKDKSTFYKVPYIILLDSDTLSRAIGKNNRKTFVITNASFAKKIIELGGGIFDEKNASTRIG